MRARDNPFRAARIDALAFRDPATTPERLLAKWRAMGRRGALIGPHGTGKTTLLAELVRRIEAEGRSVIGVRLRADDRRSAHAALRRATNACRRQGVLCVDGFDLLPAFARRTLSFRTRGLHGVIVTAHAPCPYPTLHETRTTPELLAALTAELLDVDACGIIDDPRCPDLAGLHAECEGNLRDALFSLYREFANRPQPGDAPHRGAPESPLPTPGSAQ